MGKRRSNRTSALKGILMNDKQPALLVTLESMKVDPALNERGDRKFLVTELYDSKEKIARPAFGHIMNHPRSVLSN